MSSNPVQSESARCRSNTRLDILHNLHRIHSAEHGASSDAGSRTDLGRGSEMRDDLAGRAWGFAVLMLPGAAHGANGPATAATLSTPAYTPGPSQLPLVIRWQTPIDLNPQYSGDDLLIHYGSPAITAANTIIVPVKTGATGDFMVNGLNAATGAQFWTMTHRLRAAAAQLDAADGRHPHARRRGGRGSRSRRHGLGAHQPQRRPGRQCRPGSPSTA